MYTCVYMYERLRIYYGRLIHCVMYVLTEKIINYNYSELRCHCIITSGVTTHFTYEEGV